MKLRIKGNLIRLRLERPEIEQLGKDGTVSASISFGNNDLVYQVERHEGKEGACTFDGSAIRVLLPEKDVSLLTDTEEIGLKYQQNELTILVEKDFQCLHKRPGEDEAQMFDNPLAKKG
jgi:hypothetical protein